MVVQELCRKLPAIDYHNGALLLAVGTPPAPAAAVSGSASPAPSSPHAAASSATFLAALAGGGRQAATLYDMQSGTPKFHLLTEAHAAHGLDPMSDPGSGGAAAVSALAFDAEGERMAAVSVGGGGGGFASPRGGGGVVLRVWSLDLAFTQRLQQLRGPVSLEPVFCKSVSGYMHNAMSRDTCAPMRVTVLLMSSAFVLLPMSTASFFTLPRLDRLSGHVQVSLLSTESAPSAAIDLDYTVKWEPDGRIGVMHAGAYLAMEAS